MEMVPHGRSLVKRFQGKPFVFLGVDCDEDPSEGKAAAAAHGMTWRSWQVDDVEALQRRWHYQGFPTLFVLDAKGIIRFTHVGAPDEGEVEKEVEQLLEEIGK
jgi:hypothetical protein